MIFEYIAFFIVVFTSIVGIFAIVKAITEWIFDDKDILQTVTILPLHETDERLEMALRYFLESNTGRVVIVDMGLSEESISIVKTATEKSGGIEFFTRQQIISRIDEII